MFRSFIYCFMLVSAIAHAQAMPTDAQIAAGKVACEKKYNVGTAPTTIKVSIALAQEKCKLEVDVRVLEFRARAAGSKNDAIEKELLRLRGVLDSIQKSIQAIEARKAEVPASPVPIPIGAGVPVALPVATRIDPPPLAATWDAFGVKAFSAVVYNIARGATRNFAIYREMRVVVYRNGTPIPIAHRAGGPVTFTEFYTALNRDKRPDPIPARGIDPSLVDQFYMAYEPGDEVTLVYLVPVGMVTVPGIGPQVLWGDPKRISYHDHEIEKNNGRFGINGLLGSPKYQ